MISLFTLKPFELLVYRIWCVEGRFEMFKNKYYVYGDQNLLVPAHLNFGKFILDQLRRKNDEIALENMSTRKSLKYSELTKYAVSLSDSLVKLGVQKGDIVAVGSEKRNEIVPTLLAIVFSGAVYAPFDINSGKAVLKHKLSITNPKYFIYSKSFWDIQNDILQNLQGVQNFIALDEDSKSELCVKNLISDNIDINSFEPVEVYGQSDTALILYSSGTTGLAKGVEVTHLNAIINSLPNNLVDEDLQTVYVFGEWYHNYDTFMTYKFLVMGRKIVYTEDSEQNLSRCFVNYNVNIAMLTPYTINCWWKTANVQELGSKSLKIIYSRSCILHTKVMKDIKNRFPSINIIQGYGMTEAGELTSETWGTKGLKAGSVGVPSPGAILKVVDTQTGQILGPKQPGELRIKGLILMKSYYGAEKSSFLDDEGFFKTGDLGYYDEDGYFYIVGRLKEIINHMGVNVSPVELEKILLLHPEVLDVGVVGRPALDINVGEEPMAFIKKQPLSNLTENELLEFVANEVPYYMRLTGGVRFIEKIPRNERGKIIRQKLREILNRKN